MGSGLPVRPGPTHAQQSNSERTNVSFTVEFSSCHCLPIDVFVRTIVRLLAASSSVWYFSDSSGPHAGCMDFVQRRV